MKFHPAYLAAPLLAVGIFVAVAEAVQPEQSSDVTVASVSGQQPAVDEPPATESALSPGSMVSSFWLLSFAGGLALILELLSPLGIFSRLVGRPRARMAPAAIPLPWLRQPVAVPVGRGGRSGPAR